MPHTPASTGADAGTGVVEAARGELLAVRSSGEILRLAAGDLVAPGDVLFIRGGGHVLIDLGAGSSLAMNGNARVEIKDRDGGQARVVAHDGTIVATGGLDIDGQSGTLSVETGAAMVTIAGASVALRYGLETGLSAAIVPGAGTSSAMVEIVNESGVHVLDAQSPAGAVAHWSRPLVPMSMPVGGLAPEPLVQADTGPGEALTGDAIAEGTGEPAPVRQDVEPEGEPAFAIGAGTAEHGDPTFVFAAPPVPLNGLADHIPAATLLPKLAGRPADMGIQQPTLSPSPGHDVDALFLWQPAAEAFVPPPPALPSPPRLPGWEPSGRSWETAGTAWVSSGEREYPAYPDRPLLGVRPQEGGGMAALEASEARRSALEKLLGLQHDELNEIVAGVTAHGGSAMRATVDLKAGQTLVFDVLFDAVDNLPNNDYAAFTISHGGVGEAFVLSSVATTGDLGATPWQTLRYTAGASKTFAIGFVVVNDTLPMGLSRLYVDARNGTLDTSRLELLAEARDQFGGRFELLGPKVDEERLITGFEGNIDPNDLMGRVSIAGRFFEPDGCRAEYAPTEGNGMAVLYARGGMRASLEGFLGLEKAPGAPTALPIDVDGSMPNFGAATKLSVAVAAGDQISFDWMFDAGDQLPDNDFAVFTVSGSNGSQVFKLADVRATGAAGASGWRTSVYTAASDEELTIGFAVVNDRVSGLVDDPKNSRLLVDSVWLNREFAGGYQLADVPEAGELATLPVA